MGTEGKIDIAFFLAELIVQIKTKQVAEADRAKIRQHLLDSIAAAFIGCRGEVFGDLQHNSVGTSPLDKAMLWAYAVNGSVFEDGTKEGACHPAAAIMPVVFALGQGKEWDKIDRAVSAGYDVMVRLARAGNPDFTLKGFHPTAIMAPFGAAATAAVLLDFDQTSCRNAICLAAMGGAGLMASFKCGPTQPLQVAWAVRNGVHAALLASSGHAGYPRILEEGFFPAYLSKELNVAVEASLNRENAIGSCYLKPYPGCRHMHVSMDALHAILKREAISAEQISTIKVSTYKIAVETEIHDVKSRGDAYFNIPYALASRVVLGRNDYDAFDEKHFADQRIVQLMDKVSVQVDPELDALYPKQRGACVEVQTTDGRELCEKILYARGEQENPLPVSFTRDKFRNIAAPFLCEEEMDRVESLLHSQAVASDFDFLSGKLSTLKDKR